MSEVDFRRPSEEVVLDCFVKRLREEGHDVQGQQFKPDSLNRTTKDIDRIAGRGIPPSSN